MKKKITPFSLRLCSYLLFLFSFTSTSLLANKNMPSENTGDFVAGPVQGKITDDEGNPVAGVTVEVKGGTQATTTDVQGNFTLQNVPEEGTLVITHVGFERKEIKVNNRARVNIQLSRSTAGLNEVVVVAVGYGTQRKRDMTSAVSQISGDEVRQTPVTSLQNALSGKLPGLFSQQRSGQPGNNAAAIFIRGVSTFTGSQQPLVIIDNIEYEFDQLANIDPREVESISILKDAASTSIYGIRGANGVILVTTRRGKTGKAVINLTTQAGIQTPTTILKTLGSYDVAILQNEANRNDGTAPMFTDDDLEKFRTGSDPYGHPDVNWYNTLFKKHSLMTNNNLDISGGTQRVKYFITLGYMNQGGLLRDIPYRGKDQAASGKTQAETNFFAKRYKFRSNLDIQATNTLQLQLDITGTRENANQPKEESLFPNIFRYDYASPYMMPVYNPDGSFGWGNPKWMVPPAAANNFAAVYALGGYTTSVNDFVNIRLQGTQKLDDLVKGLSLRSVVGYSFGNNSSTTLVRHATTIPSYFYNAATGVYTPKDANIFTMPPYQLSYAGGTPNQRVNIQGSLNYDNSFGGMHNVTGLFLYNQTSYINGANPPANFRGYTFRFGYNYDHRYILQVSGAYNGSDRFVSQKQYQLFPAFSAGWNIGEESFIKDNVPFIESLKLRGSYGWVGSDDIGGNQYLYEQVYNRTGTYSFGEFNNTINSIVEGTQGNNNITWQTERKADIGLDFSLLKGKITGSVDYFDNFRYDILTRRLTVPNYFGVQGSNLPPVNIGKVGNKGYEIELGYRGNISPQVTITVKGNVSFAKNKIIYMDEVEPRYPWQRQTGQSIGMIRQYTWLGFYQNQQDIDTSATPPGNVQPGYLKYQDLNGDGIINTDDMSYQGNPNLPNTNLGLTLGGSYKGLSLTVLLQSAVNFDIYMGNGNAVPFKTNLQPIHLGRWTSEKGNAATFPTLTNTFNGSYMNPDNRSTFWTTSGNYLRIRSLTLNYNVPKTIVNRIGLGGINVFMNGYDLFTWSKFMKRFQFDPEVSSGAGGYIYPTQKIVNFGLNVTLK
jgi:TonB-linked SusC/RagA family outer membrane protein